MKRLLAAMFVVLSLALSAEEAVRTWTDLKGATITAGFVQFADEKVIIRRDDGVSFKASPAIFSEKDRKYLDEIRKKLNQVPKIDLADPATREKIFAKAVDAEKLQERGNPGEELYYAPNQQTPYTGWGKRILKRNPFAGTQVIELSQYNDGKLHGLRMSWHGNGQVKEESYFKDGKMDGPSKSWHSNGQKSTEYTEKDGKRVGPYTSWHKNGQKSLENIWKDGKLWTAVGWKPNGEKSETNVVNGNGVMVTYRDDGTELIRFIFKDGEYVTDILVR